MFFVAMVAILKFPSLKIMYTHVRKKFQATAAILKILDSKWQP
jgi:hypothetical protein